MEYTLIRSKRKTISMEIKNGVLIVRAPQRMRQLEINRFLSEHKEWIETHMARVNRAKAIAGDPFSQQELAQLYELAKKVIPQRAAYYAPLIGVDYGRITIRCQKTRWGSCSGVGNLNFNCLLMMAPMAVIDSVVVHELCHRKEMNHSARFYQEVYRVFPEYDIHHKWLKEYGGALLLKAPREDI